MTADFPVVRGRSLALGLVIIPHLLLAALLLRQTVVREKAGTGERVEIVFITPAIAPKSKPTVRPITEPELLIPQAKPVIAKQPRVVKDTVRTKPSPAVEVAQAQPPAENKTETTAIDTAALIGMAGKIDREVRPPGENLLSAPEGKSLRKKLDDAFAAAHLAVPLKWYEAARVELFSAPNDPAKIYQVKTAIGTYCLFYPDKNKPGGDSGAAGFGQPRIGNCPTRF